MQAKYGHIKEVVNIAPPPIINAPTPIQYSAFNAGSNTVYNRYVPYDINAPSPPQQSFHQFNPTPLPSQPNPHQSNAPPVPQGTVQPLVQQAQNPPQVVPPPPVLTSSSSFGSNFITPAVVQTNFPKTGSPREAGPVIQGTPENSLVQVDLSSPESKLNTQRSSSFEAEEQVISSKSSSVL